MDGNLQIICEDLTNHPLCPHGPTLLFSLNAPNAEQVQFFYGCSACRSRTECPVWIPQDSWLVQPDKYRDLAGPSISKVTKKINIRDGMLATKGKHRRYCHDCGVLFGSKSKAANKHADHDVIAGLSDEQLREPTHFMRPVDNDKTQAQYFFTEKALRTFHAMFQRLNVR